jgi:hypothetical protein
MSIGHCKKKVKKKRRERRNGKRKNEKHPTINTRCFQIPPRVTLEPLPRPLATQHLGPSLPIDLFVTITDYTILTNRESKGRDDNRERTG